MKESGGKGQSTELQVAQLTVHGWADPESYPLQKKRMSFEALRDGSDISLYALDRAHGGVAFVETEPGAEIVRAPFLHQAQRNHAQRVIRVPFEAVANDPSSAAKLHV